MAAFFFLREESDIEKQGRLLWLVEQCLSGAKEVLAMRTAHFYTVLDKGQSQANQIADLVGTQVEAKRHQVPSEAYADFYAELSAKYVIETAESLARDATGSGMQPDGKK